jgi:glyoxylase-like metal-dependent hydrolase (beta-lactamase superfamily II)
MPKTLTHNHKIAFTYGRVSVLTPMIRRVVAENPSPYTFKGTGTYIVGRGEVAVIDPGPYDEKHIEALQHALKGETVTHILVTHTHRDHSPGVRILQPETDAPAYGYGPHGADKGLPKVEEGGDFDFTPDEVIKDGDVVRGKGWTIEAVHTPGHTSNHLCFALKEENTLFSGDQVMGWSTTVVSQPDGDMGEYMASLEKLLARDDAVYWPTHGPAIEDPSRYVAHLLEHRREREAHVVQCIAEGRTTIEEMVEVMYQELDPRLYGGAKRSVHSHLIHLIAQGRVECGGEPTMVTVYALTD